MLRAEELTECRRVDPDRDLRVHILERRKASGATFGQVSSDAAPGDLAPYWPNRPQSVKGNKGGRRPALTSAEFAKGVRWNERREQDRDRNRHGLSAHIDTSKFDDSSNKDGAYLESGQSTPDMWRQLAWLERAIARGAPVHSRFLKLHDAINAGNVGYEPDWKLEQAQRPRLPYATRKLFLRILEQSPGRGPGRPPHGDRARTKAEQKRHERNLKKQGADNGKALEAGCGVTDRPQATEVTREPERT
jgi:hypothetical protein